MIRIEDIILHCQEFVGGELDSSQIRKAYIMAATVPAVKKSSGKPYIEFALEVADILARITPDQHCIIAGLLHGVLDTDQVSVDQVREKIGEEVSLILEKLKTMESFAAATTEEERMVENMRQMLFATSKDVRVIFVKLAKRLATMRNLELLSEEKIRFIAKETLEIYAPIAHMLGLSHLKNDLENTSFFKLLPDQYQEIHEFCEKTIKQKSKENLNLRNELDTHLKQHGIKARIEERVKHYYSIYRKSSKNNAPYSSLYDLVATRILVNDKDDCYKALGIIHQTYQPVSGRFKDYVSQPKPNGYQSLHTTVMNDEGLVFEVQIRTENMHKVAELGVAAHWAYKDGNNKSVKYDENITWLREITKNLENITDIKESLDTFNRELYADFVYVFTPKGKIIKLPKGATVIDFAYSIHTEVGFHCSGARIGGKIVPIRTVLTNGDQVDIITNPNQQPKNDWLQYAITSKARYRIRHQLTHQEQEAAEKLGKELFNKEARKLKIKPDRLENTTEFQELIKKAGYHSPHELYVALGLGKFPISELNKALDSKEEQEETAFRDKISRTVTSTGEEALKIAGLENTLIRYANCCNPLKGDAVAGVITRGQGVSIHRANCENLNQIEREKIIELEWVDSEEKSFPATILLDYDDSIKTHLNVAKILAAEKVELIESKLTVKEKRSRHELTFMIINSQQIDKIVNRLGNLKSVSATRMIESK